MSAHTPGPWWNDAGHIRTVERDTTFPKGRKLASVHAGPVTNEQAKANAALVAAAPALLTLLSEIHDRVDGEWPSADVAKIAAVIARAEGRQP